MTRKEFLNVALLQATEKGIGIHLAKFADMCIEWATNEAIEKACEWLRVELDKEEELHYIHVHGFDKELFLEELKKAMKGGEE